MPRLVERTWIPDPNAPGGRRDRAPFKYEAFIPDEVAGLDPPLSASAFRVIAEADKAVLELNRGLPQVAGLEALARQLLRQESIASSRIEGLVMSHRRLAKAAVLEESNHRDEGAQAVLGNIRAMEHAVEVTSAKQRLELSDLLDIHRALLEATRDARWAGWVRDRQNWIGGSNYNPRGAEFVPPPEEEVERLLNDVVEFLNRDDLPATLQAAVAHAQFETIHPFADGNGRVGRCLIHIVFRRADLAPRYVPPVSMVLASEADKYIRGLTAQRNGDLEGWSLYFSSTVLRAAREARRLGNEIREVEERWVGQAGHPRADSAALRIIRLLPAQPVVTVKHATELTGASKTAAHRAISALEDAGVLKQITVGRRNRAWEGVGLLELLDSFERDMAIADGAEEPSWPVRAPRE